MKSKTILFLCLFLGIGLTHLNAQMDWHMNAEGTGVLITTFEFPFTVNAWCGDNTQPADVLTGMVTSHNVYHFKRWVYTGANEHYFGGELLSSKSDEVFKFMEKDHAMKIVMNGDIMIYGVDTFRYNCIGNEGTHYVGTCTFNIPTQTLVSVDKAICN
jgi:hypothetical protein